MYVQSLQTSETEKATEEAEVSPVMANPVPAPVASVAPPQPEPSKKQEEEIKNFRDKVCNIVFFF